MDNRNPCSSFLAPLKGLLVAGLVGLVAWAFAPAATTQQARPASPELDVVVRALDPSTLASTSTEEIEAVETALRSVLDRYTIHPPGSGAWKISPFRSLEAALTAAFGPSRVTAAPIERHYVIRWNTTTMEWELICYEDATYRVELATIVEVELKVTTVL